MIQHIFLAHHCLVNCAGVQQVIGSPMKWDDSSSTDDRASRHTVILELSLSA